MSRVLILSDHASLKGRIQALIEQAYSRLMPLVTFADSSVVNVKTQYRDIADAYSLVLSAHCKQIFPPALVNGTRCVNLHPGFNPYNRGWFPHVFSIVNGLPAGATLHVMDEQIDHGPIIAQQQVPVMSSDTSSSLYVRVLDAEMSLLERHLGRIVGGDFTAQPPSGEGNINTKQDYERLKRISLYEVGSFHAFYNRLRALSHEGFTNALIIDDYGNVNGVHLHVAPIE